MTGVSRKLYASAAEAVADMAREQEPGTRMELHWWDCSVVIVEDEQGNRRSENCSCGGCEIPELPGLVVAPGEA